MFQQMITNFLKFVTIESFNQYVQKDACGFLHVDGKNNKTHVSLYQMVTLNLLLFCKHCIIFLIILPLANQEELNMVTLIQLNIALHPNQPQYTLNFHWKEYLDKHKATLFVKLNDSWWISFTNTCTGIFDTDKQGAYLFFSEL